MGVYRLQCSVWHDSTLPRDAMTINPHFRISGVDQDLDSLCDNMATKLDTIITGHPQIQVKAYEAGKPKPNPPLGSKLLNSGASPASTVNRELALCLSYYGDANVKRKRGRLFLPLQWLAITAIGVRPTAGQRAQVTDWRVHLGGIGGVNVDWGVWSDAANAFYPAQTAYCDDEWDVIRSRGLRASTRSLFPVTP